MSTVRRFTLDATREPMQWRRPFVAVRILCSACDAPLMLVGCDLPDPDQLWYAPLDGRLRGNALQFQLDSDDPEQVRLIELFCQTKHCRGNPRATVANLRAGLTVLTHPGEHTVADLPL